MLNLYPIDFTAQELLRDYSRGDIIAQKEISVAAALETVVKLLTGLPDKHTASPSASIEKSRLASRLTLCSFDLVLPSGVHQIKSPANTSAFVYTFQGTGYEWQLFSLTAEALTLHPNRPALCAFSAKS